MFYMIYKITNTLNGKIYIGAHKTGDLNDNYMGSGKALNSAIKKYGINVFIKEILEICSNEKEMFELESVLVDSHFIARSDTYNMKLGGAGGWDNISKETRLKNLVSAVNANKIIKLTDPIKYKNARQKAAIIANKNPNRAANISKSLSGRVLSENHKSNISQAIKQKAQDPDYIQKLSKSLKGNNNPQFGKCWIHNNEKSMIIKADEVEQYLLCGWNKGRKMFK